MSTLLDRLRSEISARRAELLAELSELDDALRRIDPAGEGEQTFGNPAPVQVPEKPRRKPGPKPGQGRRPGPESLALQTWLLSWAPDEPGRVVVNDDAFRRAVEAGLVPNDRRGRERVRSVLDRSVRQEQAQPLGGGRYRFGLVLRDTA